MIKEQIKRVISGQSLTETEMIEVMNIIMRGQATDAQIACFLTALRLKGESVSEITGAARVMREKVRKVNSSASMIVDTCGTGGDLKGTFNISTTAALVTAGAGVVVAKHGNRSVSSKSGSADVLKTLGVNIEIPYTRVEECLEVAGVAFLYAPLLHPAMKHAIGPRREIGIRTIFNILGPLTNPAGAHAQVVGVYDAQLTETLARVLKNLGLESAFVVHGEDGLDEVTITTRTQISEVKDGQVKTGFFEPQEAGLEPASLNSILGGTPEKNAEITLAVLSGQGGAARDIVLLNSAFALMAAGKAGTVTEGVKLAAQSIDSGAARAKLEKLREITNK